jgi:hypothetical protein
MQDRIIGFRFGVRWVLLTAVGYLVGFTVGFVLGHSPLGYFMFGLSLGAATGFMQWLVLRRQIERSGWWVPANIVGLSLAWGLFEVVRNVWGDALENPQLESVGFALAFALGGGLNGLLQRRILRPAVRQAGWWVLASTAGWTLSLLGLAITEYTTMDDLPFVLLAGVILGIITGVALVLLLRQTTMTQVEENDHTP